MILFKLSSNGAGSTNLISGEETHYYNNIWQKYLERWIFNALHPDKQQIRLRQTCPLQVPAHSTPCFLFFLQFLFLLTFLTILPLRGLVPGASKDDKAADISDTRTSTILRALCKTCVRLLNRNAFYCVCGIFPKSQTCRTHLLRKRWYIPGLGLCCDPAVSARSRKAFGSEVFSVLGFEVEGLVLLSKKMGVKMCFCSLCFWKRQGWPSSVGNHKTMIWNKTCSEQK